MGYIKFDFERLRKGERVGKIWLTGKYVDRGELMSWLACICFRQCFSGRKDLCFLEKYKQI